MIFTKEPEGFVSEGDVVGCFVVNGREILLLRRTAHKLCGGKWGKAAGKAEPDENLRHATLRELREETGIVARAGQLEPFLSVYVVRPPSFGPVGRQFQYSMYVLRLESRPIIRLSADEHDDHVWVTPERALEFPLVDDGAECIRLFNDARVI